MGATVSQLPIDFHAASGYLGVRRLLVCGSRTMLAAQQDLIRAELVGVPKSTVIIHGDQGILGWAGTVIVLSGADRLAGEVAEELGLEVEKYPAAWRRADGSLDRSAGFRRNLEMLESGVDMVLAFWDGDSPGTAHTLREARKRGIPCRIVGI